MFDLNDGEVLWRRRPLKVLPMASLTKIMTAHPRDRAGTAARAACKITPAALRYQGSGVGVLPRGKRVPVESLLNGLLLVSGNDAAIALADHVSGNERRFVALMNRRARSLGLDCTHFVSSHGLESGNRSCARDLAVLARVAMERRRIRRIVRRRQASFRFPIKGGRLFLSGHNPLIRAGLPGHHRPEDRLHRRGRALLRGSGPARPAAPWRWCCSIRPTRRSRPRSCWTPGSRDSRAETAYHLRQGP